MKHRSLISALIATPCLLTSAGQSFGQAGEACGTSQSLLFYCTFDTGTKRVGLCLGDEGTVSYQFGADFVSPELNLSNRAIDTGYSFSRSASGQIVERAVLMNVDTQYEISSWSSSSAQDRKLGGKIIARLPSGREQTHICDPGSVWPLDPRDGIGRLSAIFK